MLSIATRVLTPYSEQKNTGNAYEIYVVLNLLRAMGLTNLEHTELKALVETIAAMNGRSSKKIMDTYNAITTKPVGEGIYYKGTKIIDLQNITQEDGVGRTGDVMLILEDGQQKSVSVCEGTNNSRGNVKNVKNVKKCISNPTCKRLGCDENDIVAFKKIQEEAVVNYKAEIAELYGPDEAKWPVGEKTKASCNATSLVASMTQNRYNGLTAEKKKEIMQDLLRVEGDSKPADILCLVNKACTKHVVFDIAGLNPARVWEPRMEVDGYWLMMYLGDTLIGKIQVKFNNGVYHKGTPSSLTSSWNATAYMNLVFDLAQIKVF